MEALADSYGACVHRSETSSYGSVQLVMPYCRNECWWKAVGSQTSEKMGMWHAIIYMPWWNHMPEALTLGSTSTLGCHVGHALSLSHSVRIAHCRSHLLFQEVPEVGLASLAGTRKRLDLTFTEVGGRV